jgi:hypothetical protein
MKVRVIKTPTEQFKDGGNWIQNAVNPAHKGYQEGWSYDVSNEEIQDLIKQGYKIKVH